MGEASTVAVTLLFTDLVGSTALGTSRSAEDAEQLRRAHFSVLREAIAATGGTEVKNLGDGLMVAFPSPSRALLCAVAMQQGIERHNRRHGEDLAVRVGLSGGEAVEEDGDYFGDPVVEAARLCALADGGQILATAVVQAMVGRHAPAELVAVGELELKGIPEPVPTVEVRWSAAGGTAAPLPARLQPGAGDSLFSFFGRTDEVAALEHALKQAATGARQVVLISGEPGMGKTSLAAYVARAAHAGGTSVLLGTCDESVTIPYQPWVAALTHLLHHQAALVDRLLDVHVDALRRLLPAAFPGGALAADDVDPSLVLDAVAGLLRAATAEDPIVLLLDDLQWADASSLDLLRYTARACPDAALLVIGTYRSSDVGRGTALSSLLADLWREPGTTRLDLDGLADHEVVDMLSVAAGHEMPAEGVALAHALRRETGGNPFFTVELLRHLAETGAFELGSDGRYNLVGDVEDLALPTSVREVVGHRVARLGENALATLSTAAVIGNEFELDVLAAITESDEDELLEVLEQAGIAGIVVEADETGRYRFVHALIGHTLVQDLSAARRRRLHERIAITLEGLGEDGARVVELARHWLAATKPADADRAIHYATAAGEQAMSALAPLDAAHWFRQALDLEERRPAVDDIERGRLLSRLALAQMTGGDLAYIDTRREASALAMQLGDRELLIEAGLCSVPGYASVSFTDPERIATIRAALDVVGPADSADRAWLLHHLSDALDDRLVPERSALIEEAIAIVERLGMPPSLLHVVANGCSMLEHPSSYERRLDLLQRATAVARVNHDRRMLLTALGQLGWVSAEVGDRDQAEAAWGEADDLCAGLGLPFERWLNTARLALRANLDGDLAAAESLAGEAFAIGEPAVLAAAQATYGAQLLTLRLQQGRLDELIDLIRQALADAEVLPAWESSLALAYVESGRPEEAAPLLAIQLAERFEGMPRDVTWVMGLVNWAEPAIALGDTDACRLLTEMLAPHITRFVLPSVHTYGCVARTYGLMLAVLGDLEAAEAMLREAVAAHERFRVPYWLARSQLDLAEVLRRLGTADAEVDALTADARATTERFGFDGLRDYRPLG